MNLTEGIRRLALLFGALGTIAGVIGSYGYLQPAMRQYEMHKTFDQLATSDVVRQERNKINASPNLIPTPTQHGTARQRDIKGLPSGAILKPIAKKQGKYTDADLAPPDAAVVRPPATLPADFDKFDDAEGSDGIAAWQQSDPAKWQYTQLPDGTYQQFPAAFSSSQIHALLCKKYPNLFPSIVSKAGVETINWNKDFTVASIETQDGKTLTPTPAPSSKQYLFAMLFPFLGFVIPWGAIRAIGWVGAGFVRDTK